MALGVMMLGCLHHPAGNLTLPATVTFALGSLLAPSAHWMSSATEQEEPTTGIHSIDAS